MDETTTKSLARLRAALASRDIVALKTLAGQFAALALEQEDAHYVDLTVLAYSLAKFLEKPYIVETPDWKALLKRTLALLDEAKKGVRDEDLEDYHSRLSNLILDVEDLHRSLGKFVSSVVEKARIKAATQMYAHGASLSKAADLAKASKRDVASYIGATHLPEKYKTLSVRRRLELAEQYFTEG